MEIPNSPVTHSPVLGLIYVGPFVYIAGRGDEISPSQIPVGPSGNITGAGPATTGGVGVENAQDGFIGYNKSFNFSPELVPIHPEIGLWLGVDIAQIDQIKAVRDDATDLFGIHLRREHQAVQSADWQMIVVCDPDVRVRCGVYWGKNYIGHPFLRFRFFLAAACFRRVGRGFETFVP